MIAIGGAHVLDLVRALVGIAYADVIENPNANWNVITARLVAIQKLKQFQTCPENSPLRGEDGWGREGE